MRAAIRIDGWTYTTLLLHEKPSDVDDIVREVMPNGLTTREVVEMPANNLSLVLLKSSGGLDPALRERFAGNEDQVTRQQNHEPQPLIEI